jgi:ATP-binding cassette subfamily C protein CydD
MAFAAVLAAPLLGMSAGAAVMTGAILVVSGPTVVGPLLAFVRPVDRPQRILSWEGSLIDPVGGIALGAPGATPAAIRKAAGLAGADDFIMALAGRYDTRLTEYGLTLSAGQRQRIALARAFLRDAPLVLLDEPTAHLDAVSAQQILATIESLAAGRTVLLASHREHAATAATRTVELDHGQLRAVGTAPAAGQPLGAGSGNPAGLVIGQ